MQNNRKLTPATPTPKAAARIAPRLSLLLGVLLLTGVSTGSGVLHAAQRTEVISLNVERKLPGLRLDASFEQSWATGQIQREYHCTNVRPDGRTISPGQEGFDPNCPQEPRIVNARELSYRRLVSTMNLEAGFGVWKDLEFSVRIPLVLHDREEIDFAGNSDSSAPSIRPYCTPGDPTCSPSSLYRESGTGDPLLDHSFFQVPNEGPSRSGLGDMTFTLGWAPYNQERNPEEATWLLQLSWLAPTGRLMSPTNNHVGRGVHELTIASTMSRRFSTVDPYFGLHYTRVIASSRSPFQKYGPGQPLVKPGDRFGILFGTEFIPWEEPAHHRRLAFDLGGEFVYQFEGRDYSPIYSFLGSSPCNDRESCSLTLVGELRPEEMAHAPLRSDGITDIEQYGQVSVWTGLVLQMSEVAKIRMFSRLQYNFDHFLTNASAGIDNGREETRIDEETGREEYIHRPGRIDPYTDEINPVFNRNLDPVGRRLRMVDNLILSFWLTASITF